MLTLTTEPVAPLLDRLFAEADGANAGALAALGDLPRGEIHRLLRSKTDYASFYTRLKDAPMAVSRNTGTLLYMLARSIGACSIVEFGTSFGLSTLHRTATATRCRHHRRQRELLTALSRSCPRSRRRLPVAAVRVRHGTVHPRPLMRVSGARSVCPRIRRHEGYIPMTARPTYRIAQRPYQGPAT